MPGGGPVDNWTILRNASVAGLASSVTEKLGRVKEAEQGCVSR